MATTDAAPAAGSRTVIDDTTTTDDGGSAFPDTRTHFDQKYEPDPGMTLRDYFAARAMQSLVVIGFKGDQHAKVVAQHAYIMADAMIAARKNEVEAP